MKKMNPLKKINKELFIGLLKKGQSKHEINFTIKEDIKSKQF